MTGVAELVALSRATLSNIRQNVGVAVGLKAVFLVTTLTGITGLWPAILADTGATVLVTLKRAPLAALARLGPRSRCDGGISACQFPSSTGEKGSGAPVITEQPVEAYFREGSNDRASTIERCCAEARRAHPEQAETSRLPRAHAPMLPDPGRPMRWKRTLF